MSTTTTTNRRPRWHPPPPPTPKILHLPRRTRRKPTRQVTVKPHETRKTLKQKENLESLFDRERVFSRTVPIVLISSGDCERRERVEDFDFIEPKNGLQVDFEEEKWRFQAEMLRAECNILRMERDIAMKKLQLTRMQTNKTLRSAVNTLISGKEKIYQGKSVGVVLEEEIGDLEEKLTDLQTCSKDRDGDNKVPKCSNFDKQASVLQRKLEKLGAGIAQEKCMNEIREMAEASLTIKTSCRFDRHIAGSDSDRRFKDVEMLRRKMQVVSKGMLERMEEEYGSLLSSTTSSTSATSSASNSRRIEFPHLSPSAAQQMLPHHQDKASHEDRMCSGHCKAIVRKIVEQVRSEMEQWSRMQEMLGRVKEEMEELQASRDFWQNRAFDSADRIQSMESNMQEWKQKARLYETKVSQLEKQISKLHLENGTMTTEQRKTSSTRRTRSLLPISHDSLKEKEKKVLICSLKENNNTNVNTNKLIKDLGEGWRKEHSCGSRGVVGPKRSPLRDIGNSSTLLKQNSRAVFPLYSPERL